MKKYQFKTIGTDEFAVVYQKDGETKEMPFKRTVELANRLQSLEADARFNMMSDLSRRGKTKKDLVVERIEDGKTVIDETNYREYEEQFLTQERLKMVNQIFEISFKKNLVDIVNELDIRESQQEALEFSIDVRKILTSEETPEANLPSA